MSSGGFGILTIKIQQMTIESTNDNNSTNTDITYSECYQQCFCSDNLELMKTIESNTIDLIYCDILYGTGRKFADYQDLKPIHSEIEAHYLPRLKEMHRVLKSTGSIYLHCDWHINHWIRCLLDEIFGSSNFVREIIWNSGNPSGGKAGANNWIHTHDNILYYAKNKELRTFNKEYIPYTQEYIKKRFIHDDQDGKGLYRLQGNDNRKQYLSDSKGKAVTSVWDLSDINVMAKERTDYQTQKPKALIERIIKASSKEGDLVADFYMGSGTTAEVCKDLKRNFIGCDINPRAIEITLQRLNDARS